MQHRGHRVMRAAGGHACSTGAISASEGAIRAAGGTQGGMRAAGEAQGAMRAAQGAMSAAQKPSGKQEQFVALLFALGHHTVHQRILPTTSANLLLPLPLIVQPMETLLQPQQGATVRVHHWDHMLAVREEQRPAG